MLNGSCHWTAFWLIPRRIPGKPESKTVSLGYLSFLKGHSNWPFCIAYQIYKLYRYMCLFYPPSSWVARGVAPPFKENMPWYRNSPSYLGADTQLGIRCTQVYVWLHCGSLTYSKTRSLSFFLLIFYLSLDYISPVLSMYHRYHRRSPGLFRVLGSNRTQRLSCQCGSLKAINFVSAGTVTHFNSTGDSSSNQVSCEFSLVLHSHKLGASPEKALSSSWCLLFFSRGFMCSNGIWGVTNFTPWSWWFNLGS